MTAARDSLLTVDQPTSALPLKPSMGCVGMRLSIKFTTPPTALPPYMMAEGPRSTSMRSTVKGSDGTAWSLLSADTSCELALLFKILILSPSMPRMMGRLALGPK